MQLDNRLTTCAWNKYKRGMAIDPMTMNRVCGCELASMSKDLRSLLKEMKYRMIRAVRMNQNVNKFNRIILIKRRREKSHEGSSEC